MFDILNTTKRILPDYPYEDILKEIHGEAYELSMVVCGTALMKKINRKTRGKDYSTDVLSFPLSDRSGELFICPETCDKKRIEHELSLDRYIGMVFVHGLVHLKGFDHGDTMEKLEASYRARFGIRS